MKINQIKRRKRNNKNKKKLPKEHLININLRSQKYKTFQINLQKQKYRIINVKLFLLQEITINKAQKKILKYKIQMNPNKFVKLVNNNNNNNSNNLKLQGKISNISFLKRNNKQFLNKMNISLNN